MFGNNPIRKPEKTDGSKLQIQQIFATFQGEGIYTGWPAIFIRLGGCNLACSFCDTEFESFEETPLNNVLENVSKLDNKRKIPLIVITGGEPLRQNINPLCEELIKTGYKIQIETNGTLYQSLPEDVDIVCSPKNNKGYHRIREDLLERINAFKFIISADIKEYSNIADVGQYDYNIPVYVQPMDEQNEDKNQANIRRTIEIASENSCRISLQTHKILGVE